MSELNAIGAVSRVTQTAPLQRVQANPSDSGRQQAIALRHASGVAATTGGSLRPATAQLVVDPHSHDVVIRVSDPATEQVIGEFGSREVEMMTNDMKRYVGAAARKRAAKRS